MTIEQVKEEAKKRFDQDLTDEQAQAWLEAHPAGELQDEELESVAGGGCGKEPEGDLNPPQKYNGYFGNDPVECRNCGYTRHIKKDWKVHDPETGKVQMFGTDYICAKCGNRLGHLNFW